MKDIKVTLNFLLIKYNCGIETNLNIFYKKGLRYYFIPMKKYTFYLL